MPALRLPTTARLAAHGFERGRLSAWPESAPLDTGLLRAWSGAWGEPPDLQVVPVLHPSAQNMSPFARPETAFHRRMLETRDAVERAAEAALGADLPRERPGTPSSGIYALPEYRERVAERHARYDALWRNKGV